MLRPPNIAPPRTDPSAVARPEIHAEPCNSRFSPAPLPPRPLRILPRESQCPFRVPPRWPKPDEGMGIAISEGAGREAVPSGDVPNRCFPVTPGLRTPHFPSAHPGRFEGRHEAHQTTPHPPLPAGADMHPADRPGLRAPFPAVPRGPLQGFREVPVQSDLHLHSEPMSSSLKPDSGPAVRQGHRRQRRPHPMAPPTAPLPLPLDSRREGPRRQRILVRTGGTPFPTVPSWVVRMVP